MRREAVVPRGIEAILFDLDGVLWESSAVHAAAFEGVFASRGIDVDYTRVAGQRTDEAVRQILTEAGQLVSDATVAELVSLKRRLAAEQLRCRPPLAPDLTRVLEELAKRHRLALVSSASHGTVELFLDLSGAREHFEVVLCGDDVEHGKPSPDIYLAALGRLGVEPEGALVVEDAVSGIRAARDAGIEVVGLAGTLLPAELESLDVREVIAELTDLIEAPPRIVSLAAQPDRPVHRESWTAVIPAAGRGTRLGVDLPKLLFPVLGRPLLDWLLDALRPSCSHFVFVVAPSARELVESEVRERLGDAATVVVQDEPLGMADAVHRAASAVHTAHALVVWSDQVLLRERTVRACASAHERRPGARLTFATVLRDEPYIHFPRDSEQHLLSVQQVREGDTIEARPAESDCGLFLFATQALFEALRNAETTRDPALWGAKTGEFNLLPVLPKLEGTPRAVLSLRLDDETESVGINTPEDARFTIAELERRLAANP